MSRLWSRFGVRALAVTMLLVGVVGGYYLNADREAQQRGISAALAIQAEARDQRMLKEYRATEIVATAQQRQAERAAEAQAAAAATAEAERARKAEQAASRKRAASRAVISVGPIPDSCGDYGGNRALGCALLLQAGFGLDQMPCLDKLWTKESHWNTSATNSGTGAYGIPQALPGSKMASVASDWKTNPATQITWGLGYIKGRYSTPCNAWAHSQATGWY